MTESLVAIRDHRDQVIARLSDAYAQDLFDVDELDRRLDLAQQARTLADLEALVADLGAPEASTALVPVASTAIDDPARPAAKRMRAIMSSIERRGPWVVPKQLDTRVFWGSVELDFRQASLGPGVTTVEVKVTMGSLEIILPPGLAIDVDVSSVMGSVEERHRAPSTPDPSRPMLRVVGRVIMGSVEVETRLPGETNGDARRRERRERKQLRKAQRGELPAGDTRALPPADSGK